MANFLVQGKLGTGKSKFCVWMAKQAMYYGRRVAGNIDIKPHLLDPLAGRYVRVPDKPSAWDLDAIGHGNPDSYDENQNGMLILDELGTWLNARTFQDKSRGELIDWLIHARKKGWDVYLIVQNVNMVDKQVREALVQYECTCMVMDRVKIPGIGWFLNWCGESLNAVLGVRKKSRWGFLPFFHLVVARIGEGAQKVVADRWTFVGRDLQPAYDTRQIFTSDYPHATHSVLPPWDHKKPVPLLKRLRAILADHRAKRADQSQRPRLPPVPRPAFVEELAKIEDPDTRWRLTRQLLAQQAGKPAF